MSRLFAMGCLAFAVMVTANAHADDDSQLNLPVSGPIQIEEDFESGASRWSPTDEKKWKITKIETDDGGVNHVYHLLGKSDYTPPHRSPHSISLLRGVIVGDFELTARVKTLQTSRAHRDMCLFFGYQNPGQFYYVHLGERTDDHANQIFVVDDAARVKISDKTNPGTPWKDDTWHTVKVVRRIADGTIEIYFDDMDTPHMVAKDKRFQWGQIGLGSFDDLGMWDDVRLQGQLADQIIFEGR